MKLDMNKNGEVSVSFLISVIVLVIGFVILLILVGSFFWKSDIDKEVCHQSIVLRSAARLKFIDVRDAVPLKCKTEKICLSMSGEDCSQLRSTASDPVRKISISACSDESCSTARAEILEAVSDSMVRCHAMLGEGKLNFMSQGFEQLNYGLICSRIVFDDTTKEKVPSLSAGEFFSYLEKKQVGEVSALEYLHPGWKQSKNSVVLFDSLKQAETSNKALHEQLQKTNYVDWTIIDTRQEQGYAVIAQISEYSNLDEWISGIGTGTAVGLGSAALLATGVGAPIGAVLLAAGGTIGGASLISGGLVMWYQSDDGFKYSAPTVYPYSIETLKGMGVYNFEIAP